MRKIVLTRGKCVVVDDGWYGVLRGYNWVYQFRGSEYGEWGYASRGIVVDGLWRMIYLHRLVSGVPRGWRVKFLDGDSLNCQRENLWVHKNGDGINGVKWVSSEGPVSRFHGVVWDSRTGMWAVRIAGMEVKGYDAIKGIWKTVFESEIEAAAAYNVKMIEVYGDGVKNLNEGILI